MKRKRNSDGTFRRADAPRKKTNRTWMAQWVQQEVAARRKDEGESFSKIAKLVVAAVRGEVPSKVSFPIAARFPADYKLTERGARKAFRRHESRGRTGKTAQKPNPKGSREERERPLSAEQQRWLAMDRLENLLLHLQPGIQEHHIPSIKEAIPIIRLSGELHGYIGMKPAKEANTLYLEKLPAERENELKLVRAMTPEDRENYFAARKRARERLREEKKTKSNRPQNRNGGATARPTNVGEPPKPGADTSGPGGAAGPQITEEQMQLALASISYEEWDSTRLRAWVCLHKSVDGYTIEQMATELQINPWLARAVLTSLRDEDRIVHFGSDQWKCIRPPKDEQTIAGPD